MNKVTSNLDLVALANDLLLKNGFLPDGTPKKKAASKKQKFFERRILMTPMGNGSK